MILSKTQSLSKNISRDAAYHEYKTGQNILVGNTIPIGSGSIDQSTLGVSYPNVQDAIGDVVSLFEMPINSVVINTDGISPEGVSQADIYKFSGTVRGTIGTDVIVQVFGIPVPCKGGDTADEFTTKAKVVLDSYAFSNKYFSSVAAPTPSEIQITYNDFKPHVLNTYVDQGIKVEQIINSPARPGYGQWQKIGTQNLSLDGQPDTPVFYFKRIN